MGENYDVPIGPLEWDLVPEYGEGKITAHLRQLTVEELDECVAPSGRYDRCKMVSFGLTGLDGLSMGGVPVTNAEELFLAQRALHPLLIEIWLSLQKGSDVTEEESKNS